jgi:transposase
MEAIEIDLRERVLGAIDQGKSRVETAKRFEVSNAWIGKLLRQRRDTGSIAPLPHAGGNPPAVAGEDLEALRAEVERKPDATLDELRKFLADERGVGCSQMAVCRALRRLGLPLKKSRSTRASATGRTWSRTAPPSPTKSRRPTRRGSS